MNDTSRPDLQKRPLQYPVSITGHASGSQVVLVIMTTGGFALVLFPVYVLSNPADTLTLTGRVALFVSVALGLLALIAVYRMWHRSQRSVDGALQQPKTALQSQVVIKPDAIVASGDEKFMRGRAMQKLIVEAMSRLHHQSTLPPACGRVEIDSSGTYNAIPFSEEEAVADAQRLHNAILRDQQRLRDIVRTLPKSGNSDRFILQQSSKQDLPPGADMLPSEEAQQANRITADTPSASRSSGKRALRKKKTAPAADEGDGEGGDE